MNMKFSELVEEMPELLQNLESQHPRTIDNLKGLPQRGVYIFYEEHKALYVGRSNRVVDRIREHCRESSRHNSATFAFNLAKEEMGLGQKTRVPRKELEKAPGFDKAFWEARKRVSEMKIRVVQIDDQVTQALFEIYAALALEAPYNDFSTH